MIKLTDDEKNYIEEYKDSLKDNDLKDFCSRINWLDDPHSIGRIIQFLMENKVDVFNYIETIPDNMFLGAEFNSITIPDHITKIGRESFKDCKNLKTVTIGESVTTIGDRAFAGCTRLRELFLPNSVKILGSGAFEGDDNLIIYAEKRSPGNRLRCKQGDMEWFKNHLFRKEEPPADMQEQEDTQL